MLSFNTFLTEQAATKLKHIEHAEDLHINDGHEGFKHAVEVLKKAKKHVEGGKSSSFLTTKYDGSPSVVFGHHPETGKFFVASKSAFNVNPKLNYTEADVEKNHGHAPGLVDKLKAALKHLPKVAPKTGVYQGDLMHTPEDLKHHDGGVSFKPNTITYKAKGEEAEKAKKSKLGIVVHTQYKGKDFASMSASPIKSHEDFAEHSDVHMIHPTYHGGGKNLSKEEENKFNDHLTRAAHANASTNHSAIAPYREHMKTYINSTIRDGSEASLHGLRNHIKAKMQKQIDAVKTAAAKAPKEAKLQDAMQHLHNHEASFNSAISTYHHVQQAKNILVNHLNKDYKGFEHSLGNKESNPEGYVASHKGQLTKLVNRREFSAANFGPKD